MFKKFFFFLIMLNLVGCDKHSGQIKPNKSEELYTFTKKLNVTHTDDTLSMVSKNYFKIGSLKPAQNYQVFYSFNSGSSTRFKVLVTKFNSKAVAPFLPGYAMVLKNKNESRKVDMKNQYLIAENTNYTLEVTFGTASLDRVEVVFDVLVWTGDANQNPVLSQVCQNEQFGKTVFIPYAGSLTVLASRLGREKFLANDIFCGEYFVGTELVCESPTGFGTEGFERTKSIVTCSAADRDTGENRRSVVEIDTQKRSAIVSCYSNDTEVFKGTFNSCEAKILDRLQ